MSPDDAALERRIAASGKVLVDAMLYAGDCPKTRELYRQHLDLLAQRSPERVAELHAAVMGSAYG